MRGRTDKMGRRWRILHDWRFDLVMGAVVIGCVLLLLQRQAYQPTGDELYDDYARLLIKKYNKEYPGEFWLWVQATILKKPIGVFTADLPEIAEWEDQYGDDPRYWQLFRDCRASGRSTNKDYDESIRNGVFNEASFYYVAWDIDRSSTSLTEEECYDQAIALNPDNAYYYYFKALHCLYEKQIDDSWDALRIGNAASECYISMPFPDGFIVEHHDEPTPMLNKLAAGMVHRSTVIPNYLTIKTCIGDATTSDEFSVEPEYLDDLAWAQLRLMKSEKYLPVENMIYCTYYRKIICDGADKLITLSPEQAREYAFVKQQIKQVKEIVRAVPNINWQDCQRSSYCELYDAIELEGICCQKIAALHEGYPRYPLSSWARGELAGYPVPEDFEPLPKYLPQAE